MQTSLECFSLSKLQESMLSYLITSTEDFDEFVKDFWRGTRDCQTVDITNYLLHKVDKLKLTLPQFRNLFDVDPKNSFQVLTQRPVAQNVTNTIINELKNGTITLDVIFDNYMDDRLKSVNRIVQDYI